MKSEILEGFVVLFTTAFNEDSFAENELQKQKSSSTFVKIDILDYCIFFAYYFDIESDRKDLTLLKNQPINL